MAVRIKYGDCVPFPDKQGIWVRHVVMDDPNNKGQVIIVQGQMMLFEGDEIILLDQGAKTTVEVVKDGDAICSRNGQLVAYSPLLGVGITKKAAAANTEGAPINKSIKGQLPPGHPGLIIP